MDEVAARYGLAELSQQARLNRVAFGASQEEDARMSIRSVTIQAGRGRGKETPMESL